MEKITNFEKIKEKLQKRNKITKMVVAGADNESILECCRNLKDLKITDSILVGDKQSIIEMSSKIKINISDFEIVDMKDENEISRYSSKLIHDGKANIFAKGSVETKPMMKAILDKEIGIKDDNNISLTSIFEMNQNGKSRLLLISDPGIRPYPTLEEKISIINHSVEVAHVIGIENPKVAVLSAIEVVNPKMKETVEADKLSKMNDNGEIKGCIVDGPISLDLALDPEACVLKKFNNRKIQGDADILIFHDIHSANYAYKIFTHLLKWKTGSILVGTKAPCILTSRSDNFDTKFNSIILSGLYYDYLSNKKNL
jgi:phosphate butyryltransferase